MGTKTVFTEYEDACDSLYCYNAIGYIIRLKFHIDDIREEQLSLNPFTNNSRWNNVIHNLVITQIRLERQTVEVLTPLYVRKSRVRNEVGKNNQATLSSLFCQVFSS